MTFGKCYYITHTKRYTLNRQKLEYAFEQKDLEVILSAELKLDERTSMKVKKVNVIVELIRRNFSYLYCLLLKKLFTTFVRRNLECGQTTWAPYLKKYVTMLENVQRKAAKLVDEFHHLSYSGRLRRLNLPSLVYRRV